MNFIGRLSVVCFLLSPCIALLIVAYVITGALQFDNTVHHHQLVDNAFTFWPRGNTMEPTYIIEEQFTIPLRGPTQEHQRLLWRCPKDAIEVPILVQSGRVWRASTYLLCGQRISRRHAQRELNVVFAYEAWERDQQAVATYLVVTRPSTPPFPIREEHCAMSINAPHANETRTHQYPVDAEITDATTSSDPETLVKNIFDAVNDPAQEPAHKRITQKASVAAKTVLKTVGSITFGAGVVTGTTLLWGAAEIAKWMLTTSAATMETDTQAE